MIGGAMKYFLKKSLGYEIFRSIVSWATIFVLKNLQHPPARPPTHLMYSPLEALEFVLIFSLETA